MYKYEQHFDSKNLEVSSEKEKQIIGGRVFEIICLPINQFFDQNIIEGSFHVVQKKEYLKKNILDVK